MKILRPALIAALLVTSLPLAACNRGAGASDGHGGFTNMREARREQRRAERRAEGGGVGGDREARRAERRAERDGAAAPASTPAQ